MAKRRWFPFVSKDDHTAPGGVNDAWWITTESYAKENSLDSPYLIPNEWICGRLASILCLPVPPFSLFREGGKGKFASLRFSKAPPPDADAVECVKVDAWLCTGIVLFDVLIANSDRHLGNIGVDRQASPRDIWVFDHDHALFGSIEKKGKKRLDDMEGRLGISAGSKSGGNRHVLLDELATGNHFREWISRIDSIPEWYIKDACHYVHHLGATQSEINAAIRFLKLRKRSIEDIVKDNQSEFTSIRDWGLFP